MGTTTFEEGLAGLRQRLERVDAELRDCDVSLERLQADAAEAAWKARGEAEAAIADVRRRRIELGERLAELSLTVNRKEQAK